MANEEQLAILKRGAKIWNKWREENENVKIDLSEVDLNRIDISDSPDWLSSLGPLGSDWKADLNGTGHWKFNLIGINLNGADLHDADLRGANLRNVYFLKANLQGIFLDEADLSEAHLNGANLIRANFQGANLSNAYLNGADLSHANFQEANLTRANLLNANLLLTKLSDADLSEAILIGAVLEQVHLDKANFGESSFGGTSISNVDLSKAKGLKSAHHHAASNIDNSSIKLSKGKIPEYFLKGFGFSAWESEFFKLYNPKLDSKKIREIQNCVYNLRIMQAIQINPLFISYSHGDMAFVDKIDAALTAKGVHFYRDDHNLVAGRMETQIDRAIRQNPTVLLVLSKNSWQSDWVEHEVNEARKVEKELKRDVLCPVALDDNWMSSKWEERIMEQIKKYYIIDFSKWEDESVFEEKFASLLSGLDLFYKKPEA